jgi:hypothetical protein
MRPTRMIEICWEHLWDVWNQTAAQFVWKFNHGNEIIVFCWSSTCICQHDDLMILGIFWVQHEADKNSMNSCQLTPAHYNTLYDIIHVLWLHGFAFSLSFVWILIETNSVYSIVLVYWEITYIRLYHGLSEYLCYDTLIAMTFWSPQLFSTH